MLLPTLYALSNTGKTLIWQIEIKKDKYRTITGAEGAKLVTSEWTTATPKNENRANATTGEEQAQLEATARWEKKLKSGGYWEDKKDIDKQSKFVEPMLAYLYEDYKDKIVFPVLVDRKFNGMRQVTTRKGQFSRKGEPILSAPHIFEQLKPLFDKYPDLVFDGELYDHKKRFALNDLIHLVRRTKNITKEHLAESAKVVLYYIYDGYGFDDVTEESPIDERREGIAKIIKTVACPSIVLVNGWIAKDTSQLDELYKSFVKDGYEGAIIRLLNSPYEHKRSRGLLKVKPVDDAEFKIIDIKEGEGNWAGAAKTVTLEMDDGKRFDGAIKGTYESGVKILKEKKSWIGKKVTVSYNGKTGLGTPQFAQLNPENCKRGD